MFLWIFNSIVVVGITALLLKQHRYQQQLQRQLQLQKRLNSRLQQDMRAICSGAVGVGQRLLELEQLSKQLLARLEVSDHRDIGLSNYSHAAKLIEMGAPLSEVQSSCGLTTQEVELLAVLHRQPLEVEDVLHCEYPS